MPETLYTVAQVSELTHLPTETIYAWERRYKAIVPNRTASGRRAYSGQHIERLKLLKACIEEGSRIGTIAHLSEASLHELAQSSTPRATEQKELASSAHALDIDEIESRLGIAFMSLGPVGFADMVLSPLLAEVASRWEEQEKSIAAEHLVSATAKSIMFAALRLNRPRASKSSAVFATPDGEAHEIALLAAALAAQSCGVRAIYLGAQLPPLTLVGAAAASNADLIVLSSSVLPSEFLFEHVKSMREKVPGRVRIACGGCAFEPIRSVLPTGVSYFVSVLDFERTLLAGVSN